MSELNDFKFAWKSQTADPESGFAGPQERTLLNRLDKQRKKIRRNNILITAGMGLLLAYLIFIGVQYKGQAAIFYLAIGAVIVLEIVVVFLLWQRGLKKVEALSMSSLAYVDFQLKRLKRSRLMIEYSPLYGFLLGICVNAYIYSLIGEASPQFAFWIVNITWVYILLMGAVSYLVKMKRFKRDVEPMIEELEEICQQLNR